MTLDKKQVEEGEELHKSLGISMRQYRVLQRLHSTPNLLKKDAVQAFFAWSDKGERYFPLWLSLSRPLGRMDLDTLQQAFSYGMEREVWKTGYGYQHPMSEPNPLYDFEHENTYRQALALDAYREVHGNTTYVQQVENWWKYGWRAGYPQSFPVPEGCDLVCRTWRAGK